VPPLSPLIARLFSPADGDPAGNQDEVDQGGYTAKQRLRDETESPFRKARQFLVPWMAGSAALGEPCLPPGPEYPSVLP